MCYGVWMLCFWKKNQIKCEKKQVKASQKVKQLKKKMWEEKKWIIFFYIGCDDKEIVVWLVVGNMSLLIPGLERFLY